MTLPLQRTPLPVERDAAPAPAVGAAAWQRHYRQILLALDAAMVLVATFAAARVRFGENAPTVQGLSYVALSGAIALAWLVSLGGVRAYEHRYLGSGSEEYKRVGSASIRLLTLVATLAYVLHLQVARGYVAVALPLGTILLLIGRYAARRWLHEQRADGRCLHRVLAVGSPGTVAHLEGELSRTPHAGLRIVGACTPFGAQGVDKIGSVPIVGSLGTVADALELTNADTVAVTSGPGMTPEALRRLSWELEGTGVDLIVAPALTDVAGPRINIRPVAGLPLLHVDEPELTGMRQRLKTALERAVATAVFILVLPMLAALMLAICIESRGAPLFRQTRVGRHGREFTVLKLRTMRADADTLLAELEHLNEHGADVPLFKVREDPRVTRIGGWLRKWSLDELPQLWNVVRGDMSIIGPRPPLPAEVAKYGSDAKRRLLVRPGMTGLWQVSGRSDLSWDDTVRLDLYYVENWSFAMDLTILWKTAFAVLRGRGAY